VKKKLYCVVRVSFIKLTWNTLISLALVLQNSLCLFRVLAVLLQYTIVLQSTVTLKLVIATGMVTCCSTSQLTSLSTTQAMIAEETWCGRMQLWRAKGMNGLKKPTSQFVHLEMFIQIFSSSSFVIRVNLLHLQPSLFLYGLLLSLWCFSILGNYHFQVSKYWDWTPVTPVTHLLLSLEDTSKSNRYSKI